MQNSHDKLKVGLLVNGVNQRNLNGEIIKNIINNKKINIDTLIINKKTDKKSRLIYSLKKHSIKRLIEKILFKMLTEFEKFIFICFFKKFHFKEVNLDNDKIEKIHVNPIKSKLGGEESYSEQNVKAIKNRNLDIILRLDGGILKGEILKASKNGVISFHHGDNNLYRGLPAGFWEIYYRNPTTGFVIQKLNENLDAGDILFKGHFPTKFFYYYNQQFIYKQSAKYINQVFDQFINSESLNYLEKKDYKNKIFKDPDFFQLLKYIFSTYSFLLLKALQKLMRSREVWSVAFLKGNFDKNKLEKLKIIKNFENRFMADPFLIKVNGKNYIFVEDYSFKNKKGSISCYELNDIKENFLGKVIEEDFHLSFPFLFKYENNLYMCPETHEKNEIRIYQCDKFPLKWRYYKTLIKNIYAVDTVLFEKNSVWWLLTNTDSNKIDTLSELSIFYSKDGPLSNNWKPHKKNPVIVNANIARNAGLVLNNNSIYRMNQKVGFNIYGKEFDINIIKNINENNFVEEKIENIKPNFFKNIHGTHHLSYNEDYSVIDFVKRNYIFDKKDK